MSLVSHTTLTTLNKEDTLNNTTYNINMTIDNPAILTTTNGRARELAKKKCI
ncbi:hypothetical protein KM1_335420 [Entamoeba histolytica HM-3:IMSS]|uniref:Uncharacterized protein n=1 Tax=Entamoeba histolytica HM-3:IMSS TaxID=885315 RepID=M7WE64_ENTHI|nr:hypothetical protein KM1_335420 [Entamoeba histolytica HM-3:IMSS]